MLAASAPCSPSHIARDETSPLPAHALLWDGSESRDWFDANNWTPGGLGVARVPGMTDSVIVPAGLANQPRLTGCTPGAAARDLIVEAGASLESIVPQRQLTDQGQRDLPVRADGDDGYVRGSDLVRDDLGVPPGRGSQFVLGRRDASLRVPGHPWTPLVFLALVAALLALLLASTPLQALLGAAIVAAGVPVHRLLTRSTAPVPTPTEMHP